MNKADTHRSHLTYNCDENGNLVGGLQAEITKLVPCWLFSFPMGNAVKVGASFLWRARQNLIVFLHFPYYYSFTSLERLPHCIGICFFNEGLTLISLLRAQTSSNADMFFFLLFWCTNNIFFPFEPWSSVVISMMGA